MTIKNKIGQMLMDNGLCGYDALIVMGLIEQGMPEMSSRWNDDVEGYPIQLLAVLIFAAKQTAVKWIENNKQNHSAKAALLA
jgi:hypothetical protein